MINFLNHLIKSYSRLIDSENFLYRISCLNLFSSFPNDLKKNPLKTMTPANAVDAITLSIGRLSKKVTIKDIPAATVANGNQRFIASSFLSISGNKDSSCLIYLFLIMP